MTDKLAIERRLMRSMIPNAFASSVDSLLENLDKDPLRTGNNALNLCSQILSWQPLGPGRTHATNLFFAGLIFTRALERSPEFAKSISEWLDREAEDGKFKIIDFKEGKEALKGTKIL